MNLEAERQRYLEPFPLSGLALAHARNSGMVRAALS
jgi:hypothetical protein